MSKLAGKLRKMDAGMTPGPWDAPANSSNCCIWFGDSLDALGEIYSDEDRRAVVALRNALPALADYIEALEQGSRSEPALERLEKVLEAAE